MNFLCAMHTSCTENNRPGFSFCNEYFVRVVAYRAVALYFCMRYVPCRCVIFLYVLRTVPLCVYQLAPSLWGGSVIFL